MSALTPHIRVLRAEAEALRDVSDDRLAAASSVGSAEGVAISLLQIDLARAKNKAADALEAEEREMEARVTK